MRVCLIVFIVALYSCNSAGKSDPNKAMDDTARMDNPPKNSAGINPVKIQLSDIPPAIKVKGTTKEAWKWNDNQGENIFITSYTEPYDDKRKNEYDEEGQTAELYASLFQKNGDRYESVWLLKDEEVACPFDITCGFISNSTTVTDLDADGAAEIKVQYSLACRSDVSPAAMKLVMYENGDKYSLNGLMWLASSPDMKYEVTENDVNLEKAPKIKDEMAAMLWSFGRYKDEKDFAKAPPAFLSFAKKEWLKNSIEKMGE